MRRLVLALAAVSVLGCGGGGDSIGPEAATAAGTWNLATVNSAPLPFILFDDAGPPPYRIEVTADQFILSSNGTFTQNTTFLENDDGTQTTLSFPDAGTWTQTETSLTFTFNSTGESVTLALSGDTATYTEPGFVSVYERQ